MSIDALGRRLWQAVSPVRRAAFFSCLIAGYLCHLYAFTNLIPNSDGLSRVFDPQQMTVSGRWFLHFASYFNGFTQMPAVIGLFSVLFLALAAALAVSLLGIRSRALSALSGALMAAFPAVGYTFLYLFTASAYCFAIFLAVLSVSLARRGRWHWLAGCLLLACSMGTYQAYVTVAIGLSLLVIFWETLDPSASFSATLRLGVRLMLFLAAGAVLYYGILLVFLQVKDLELLSYLGMDAASSGYPFSRLPGLLLDTYKQVAAFFFLPGSANTFTSGWMAVLDLAALALGGGCFLLCMGQEGLWRARWRPLGGLAMLALLPLGINFGQILSPWSAPTPLMKYAFVLVYLAVVLLADRALPAAGAGAAVLRRRAAPCAALWLVLLLLFSLNTNNRLYTASAQAHRATLSYATRLASRIESCPGYTHGMPVYLIGSFPTDRVHNSVEGFAQVDHYSVPLDTVAPLNKHIYYYLRDWLNLPIEEPAEADLMAMAERPEFAAMPRYPDDGSVQIIDGCLVVKVQEEYTPKSDFEIAYENRR